MLKRLPQQFYLLFSLLAAMADVRADDTSDLRVSGYGTLGLTWDDRRDMAPMRDLGQLPKDVDPPRAGYATKPNGRLDSRFGMQADYRMTPWLEWVGQMVLRDHVGANLNNSIETAYVGLRPWSALDLRIGRFGYDAFLMSDTRNLGYSYSWVRPPPEFYGWIPVLSINGIDAAYTFDQDDVRWRLKAQAGQSRFSIPMGTSTFDYGMQPVTSVTLSRQAGPLRLKAGYSRFTITDEAAQLLPLATGLTQLAGATSGAYPQISGEAADLSKHLSFRNAKIDYVSLGASYDDGHWVGQAEWGKTTSSAHIVPHGSMGYFGLGRRFGDWTPYALLSWVRPAQALRQPATDWSVVGQADLQTQALYVLNTTRMSQDTLSLGLRWDFDNQAALKLQWDTSRVDASGYGLWVRNIDINGRSSRINLLTLSLDFVF